MIMIHEGRKAIDLSGTWKYRYETEKTGGNSAEDFMPERDMRRMAGKRLLFRITGI